jgi:hypothetical protein
MEKLIETTSQISNRPFFVAVNELKQLSNYQQIA